MVETPSKEKLKGHSKYNESEDKIDINSLPDMSVEDVDNFLAEQDPDFLKTIEGIRADKSLTVEQIIIDDETAALHAEIDLWSNYKGFRKIIFKVIPFAPRISLKLKSLKFKIVAFFQAYWIRFKHFSIYLATEGRKKAVAQIKTTLKKRSQEFSDWNYNFGQLKLRSKLIFFFSVLLFGTTFFVAYLGFKSKLMPHEKEMFLTGFTHHSTKEYEYDPNVEVEPYIDNPRAAQNLILIPKLIVNLKRLPDSKDNPMAAFEFFIEGMSSDVVVEIKDREHFIKDIIQRSIEEMTFDELDSENGKKDLCVKLQKEISKVLVTGRVKTVRIKTIILKH